MFVIDLKRLVSAGARPRVEIIQDLEALIAAAPAPPAPAPEAEAPAEVADPADEKVISSLQAIEAAIQAALDAQAADPDNGTNPADQAVQAGLQQLLADLASIKGSQDEDIASEEPLAEPTPDQEQMKASALSRLQALGAQAAPVDDQGNVQPKALCGDPECRHEALQHQNLKTGRNSGPCTMADCPCEAMAVQSNQMDAEDPADTTGGVNNDGGDASPSEVGVTASAKRGALAQSAEGDGIMEDAPPVASRTLPPEVEANPLLLGQAFTIPVGVIEGEDTGDGRSIEIGALSWRVPPLALMGLETATHDPAGFDQNDPAVICGIVEELERVAGEDGSQIILARGHFLSNEAGEHFSDLVAQMGRCGISADIAADEVESIEALDDGGTPTIKQVLVRGSIMAFTVCPMPAFEGCYIVLGDGMEQPAPIPMAAGASPAPAAPIHWLDYAECVPCSSGAEVIVASGGPLAPPASWFDNPHFTIGDGRLVEIYEKRGTKALGGRYACPPTITEDGRYFGHIAPWGVCHTGIKGECVLAPRSKQGYAQFLRSQTLLSAEGQEIRVGTITMGTGHADQRAGAGVAMGHYDNTGFQVADVTVGDDEFGIWFSGALRPGVTEEQKRILRASPLSGDWRPFGGSLELVAALAVNQPGFPIALVASGQMVSLVGPGAFEMKTLIDSLTASGASDDLEQAQDWGWAPGALLRLGAQDARQRLAALSA